MRDTVTDGAGAASRAPGDNGTGPDRLVRISMLGPLRVRVGEHTVDVGPAKQQCVLAILALDAGRVVPVDTVIDRVWGEEPPEQARKILQTYLARLRSALASVGVDAGAMLRFTNGGYRLELVGDQIDVQLVRGLLAHPSFDAEQDAERMRLVLDAFRGEPLAGVECEWAQRTRESLGRQRLAARRRLTEATLRLGGHVEVLTELEELGADNPLDERVAALRMLALYRCGRPADALGAYRTIRDRLVEELGDDPGAELQELHDKVLRRDPDLAGASPPPAAVAGSWVRRDDLPRDTPGFVGRTREIDRLLGAVPAEPDSLTVLAIDGMAGVGKTALALKVAWKLEDVCPDGRLFLDLRGHNPEHPAISTREALAALLRALGVTESAIPASVAERAAAWRARLAGRRVLVVLDGARDAKQVRPLLPGARGCVVIVTSRSWLAGLSGANTLSLELLPAADARDLFDAIVGSVAAAEPGPGDEVVRLCGYLPLAVELAATRLRGRPTWTVTDLLGRLADSRRRLTELRADDVTLTSAFDASYRELPAPLRRMFRRLGAHQHADLNAQVAAALAGIDPAEAEAALEQLVDHRLLLQPRSGCYQLHDLLRSYAQQLALEDHFPPF
jgi:DNA-binding SARP family transcriptional activator